MEQITAKQQAIINAYGNYWQEVKGFVDVNGWCEYNVISHGVTNGMHPKYDLNLDMDLIRVKNDYGAGNFLWQPKQLAGLEDNLGWIIIESEDDLPKEPTYCWFLDKERGFIAGKYLCNGKDNIAFILENATHYQPISKPQKPIY